MNTLFTIIVVLQVVAALTIIGLVLLQHGKGADMGAAFGSGASGSLFGASGSSNFLSKSTGVAAAIFFGATLGLAYLGNHRSTGSGGVIDQVPSAPAAPAPNANAPAAPGANAPASNAPAAPQPAPAAGGAGQSNQIPK